MLLLVVALFPGSVSAQEGRVLSVDSHIGITFPTGDLSADGMDGWPALRLGAELPLVGPVSAYAAVQRHAFRCGGDCEALGTSPRVGGGVLGLQYRFPSPQEAEWWARAGVVLGRFSSDSLDGERTVGAEVAGGVEIPVRRNFFLNPSASVQTLGISDDAVARYLTFGVGLTYRPR